MTTPRDWADEAASVLWALDVARRAQALREPRNEVCATCDDIRKVYEAGHAAGKREAVTWRDPVADPPEVPEGEKSVLVLVDEPEPGHTNPRVTWYMRGGGWCAQRPRAWLPIPPLPEVTP